MSTKRIHVKCGTGRRFVKVDFDSIEKTEEEVKKKWGLTADFILRGPCGDKGEQQIDIVDDDDLGQFKDADTLYVHLLTDAVPSGATPFLTEPGKEVEGQAPPPSYEECQRGSEPQVREQKGYRVDLPDVRSNFPQDGQPTRERRISVLFEGATAGKRVSIDMESLQNTKSAIRQKLSIPNDEDFDLLGKLRNEENSFDIEGDSDLEDIVDADHLIVRHKPDRPDKPSEPKVESDVKQVTVSFNGENVTIQTDMRSLDKIKHSIAQAFRMEGDFEIVARRLCTDDYPPYHNIQNDSALLDLNDAVEFIVQQIPLSQEQMPSTRYSFPVQEHASFPSVALHAPNGLPPTAEPSSSGDHAMHVESAQTQSSSLTQVSTKSRKYLTKCGKQKKTITVDFDKSVKDIRKQIGERFSLKDDFRLLAIKENREEFDIDDGDDFDDFEDAVELVAVELDQEIEVLYTPGAAREIATRQDQDIGTYANEEQAKKTMVQYRGKEYSVLVPPETKSIIVEEQERDLAGNFNVPSILDQLDSTADCLRLAYLGTLGDNELHKIVTDLQFDVLRLSKLCDDTIVEFRIKSGSIIEDLEAGFTFLFEGHDQFALSNFRSIGGTSKEMLQTTKALKREFDEKAKHISKTLDTVMKRHRDESEPLHTISSDAEANLQKRTEEAGKTAVELEKKCKELEADISDKKETFVKEGDVEEDIFKWIEQGWVKNSDLQNVAKINDEILETIAKEGRLRALEKAHEARNEEIRVNKEMTELIQQMKRLNPSDDREGIFAMALRGAETGVKNLQASLESVASFWKTLAVQCNYITGDKIESVLEHACKDTDRDTENPFWSKTPFKLKVVRFYAKWVAVRKTCDKFHNGMEKVEKGINLCLRDNPNVREARERMPKLMHEFNQKTEYKTQSIEKQNESAVAEKKELQKAIKSGQ